MLLTNITSTDAADVLHLSTLRHQHGIFRCVSAVLSIAVYFRSSPIEIVAYNQRTESWAEGQAGSWRCGSGRRGEVVEAILGSREGRYGLSIHGHDDRCDEGREQKCVTLVARIAGKGRRVQMNKAN